LVLHPNQTYTKEELYRNGRKEEYYFSDHVINVPMRRLRIKIEEDPLDSKIITTLWGIGYRLD
jgi:DNA-binding response OmpR family regulator